MIRSPAEDRMRTRLIALAKRLGWPGRDRSVEIDSDAVVDWLEGTHAPEFLGLKRMASVARKREVHPTLDTWRPYDPDLFLEPGAANWSDYVERCRILLHVMSMPRNVVLADELGRQYRLESVTDHEVVWSRWTPQTEANRARQRIDAARGVVWPSDESQCMLAVHGPGTIREVE